MQIKNGDEKLELSQVAKKVLEARKASIYDDLEALLECTDKYTDKDGIRNLFQLIEQIGSDLSEFQKYLRDTDRIEKLKLVQKNITERLRCVKETNRSFKAKIQSIVKHSKIDLLKNFNILQRQCEQAKQEALILERNCNELQAKRTEICKTTKTIEDNFECLKHVQMETRPKVSSVLKDFGSDLTEKVTTVKRGCENVETEIAQLRQENSEKISVNVLLVAVIIVTLLAGCMLRLQRFILSNY